MSGPEFPFISQCKKFSVKVQIETFYSASRFHNYILQVFPIFSGVFGTDCPSETDRGSWLHVVQFSHGGSTGLFPLA